MPLINRNVKPALGDFALFIQIPGFMAAASLPVILLTGEIRHAAAFVLTAAGAVGAGQILKRLILKDEKGAPYPIPLVTVAASWFCASLIYAVPFFLLGRAGGPGSEAGDAYRHFLSAWFEAMSALTSTGLSMSEDPSRLPASLHWWRSFGEWVGGVGIVVLTIAALRPAENKDALYRTESREEKLVGNIDTTAKNIWRIYLGYTAAAVGAFFLAGMPPWEALNHGMSGIATGGFSITPDSFASYGRGIKTAAVVIMVTGSLSFVLHSALLAERNMARVLRNTELRTYLVIFSIGVIFFMLLGQTRHAPVDWVDRVFQWTSALGTCGFSTTDLGRNWDAFGLLILVAGMIIGGCSGSTTGGIKMIRVAWLFKGWHWKFSHLWNIKRRKPRYVHDGEIVALPEANKRILYAGLLVFAWLSALAAGTLVMLAFESEGMQAMPVFFAAASALGNVGLDTGFVNTELHAVSKTTLIFLMWMGRLEIFGVLMLAAAPAARFLRRHRRV